MKPILTTLGILAVLGVLAAVAVIYSGVFNVAATVVDATPLRWLLVTTREQSVKRRARDIQVPTLGGAEQVEKGFSLFRAECAMCHTAVGRNPSWMARGLNPVAPTFGKDADDMSAAELFWATKNGIRFTGMPAWGPSRSDQEIWDVVAFMMTFCLGHRRKAIDDPQRFRCSKTPGLYIAGSLLM
jgi:mono/diheme cytochrome c family protein